MNTVVGQFVMHLRDNEVRSELMFAEEHSLIAKNIALQAETAALRMRMAGLSRRAKWLLAAAWAGWALIVGLAIGWWVR